MTEAELEAARAWIGREAEAEDLITPRLAAEFAATLAPGLFPQPEGVAPLGLHWALAPEILPLEALGEDGQARTGGFWPPTPLPRRMWAAGEIELLRPLNLGDKVLRTWRIDGVELKQGRTGPLLFVSVSVTFFVGAQRAVEERRRIVYRGVVGEAAAPSPAPIAEIESRLDAGPVRLLRYSALTFNAHRIHFDAAYAREVELYQGLVVHGPLQATWALNAAAQMLGAPPRRFSYRAQAPLYADASIRIGALRAGPEAVEAWTASPDGRLALSATANAL